MLKTVILASCLPCAAIGQTPSSGHAQLTHELKALGDARTDAARDSISSLIKLGLRGLLDTDSAFAVNFNDMPMSRVDAPDGSFRLFTWNVQHDDGSFHYEGFLLVKEHKAHVLYTLRDMTDHIPDPEGAQLSPENWYGALYYAAIPVQKAGRAYYTLLGWKGASETETRKVIDVLSFSGPLPKFGAPLFSDGQRRRREIFAYTAQASMQLKWDADRKAIVLDHLAAVNREFAGDPAFMAPDLSFDAYVWDKGRWTFQRDIDLRQTGKSRPYNAPPKEEH